MLTYYAQPLAQTSALVKKSFKVVNISVFYLRRRLFQIKAKFFFNLSGVSAERYHAKPARRYTKLLQVAKCICLVRRPTAAASKQ